VRGMVRPGVQKGSHAEGGASGSLENQHQKSSSGMKVVMDAPLGGVIAALAQLLDVQRMELWRWALNLVECISTLHVSCRSAFIFT
jgi:hypothetical protein